MPTIWASPSLIYLYAWYAIVGGAFTLLNNQHVRMDALYMRFSARRQAIMDAATSVCIFVVAGMLIYTGIDHTVVSILSGEKAFSAWHEVIWPVRMCIPVGAFLLLVQAIAKFLRNLSVIFRGTDFEYKNQSPYVKMV